MLDNGHFDGGKNLTKGSRKSGDEKILVELMPQPLSSAASAGGGATESLACSGLKATDEVVGAMQSVKGALGTALLTAAPSADNVLDCEWTGDPGAGSVIKILVRRDLPKS